MRRLHRCTFLDEANTIVLVGGPGSGKTHIATAIGVQAIEHHHKRVWLFSTVELVNAREQEKSQGRPGVDWQSPGAFRSRHPGRGLLFRPLRGKYNERSLENVVLGLQFLDFPAKAVDFSFYMLRDCFIANFRLRDIIADSPAIELPYP